jgi:large subunit ribosomal protein L9
LATSSAKKVLAENLKQRAHKEAKVISDAEAVADALKAIEIKIVAKAGGEKLFGSITNIDAAVLAKGGQVIDRKFITSGIVKRTGKYSASVRLHRDVIIELPYEIIAEE